MRLRKKVVLFLPGFQREDFDPKEKGAKIKESLEKKGFKVFISNYAHGKPMKRPIKAYVEQVKQEIEAVKPGVIVAHCMGGLMARKIIESSSEDLGVEKLIMLETPNLGTTSARMKILGLPNWPSIQDMLKGSEFLRELNENWRIKRRKLKTHYFQIGGTRTIWLPEIFQLPEVKTATFPGVNHSQLRTDFRVIQKIIKILTS